MGKIQRKDIAIYKVSQRHLWVVYAIATIIFATLKQEMLLCQSNISLVKVIAVLISAPSAAENKSYLIV